MRLAQLTTAEKNDLLLAMANAIVANAASILEANQVDLNTSGLAGAMRERLLLNPERIAGMASGAREVAGLADPVGETLAEWTRPNGLRIRKVRVPLGVVGVIYLSGPRRARSADAHSPAPSRPGGRLTRSHPHPITFRAA